jgi:dipeptidyl aminopeptidase/acylaminoacyl peptidase
MLERQKLYATFGSPQENPAFWNALSANSFITQPITPIQLHHGLSDTVVPVNFSRILTTELKNVQSPVQLYTYPRTDHNLSQRFGLAMRRSVAFFDRYLKAQP